MNRRPDYRRVLFGLFPMIQVCGPGVMLFTVVGTLSAVPAHAQTERVASLEQQSTQYSEAFENWMLLAIEGDAEAQFNLGLLYSEGKGIPVDYVQAAFWYRKGAEQGHTGAQYNLAHLYVDGHGLDKDPVRATHWWRQAAQRGHVLAQQYLGYAYYKGIGVNRDPQKALRWFREAAKGGDKRAEIMLANIEQNSEPAPSTSEQQNPPPDSTSTHMPQSAPDRPTLSPAKRDDNQSTLAASLSRTPTPAGDKQQSISSDPKTVSPHSNPDPQPASRDGGGTSAVPVNHQATALGKPELVAPNAPKLAADSAPMIAQLETQSVPSTMPVAAANTEAEPVSAPPEREDETVRQPQASKDDPTDISVASQPLAPAADDASRRPHSESMTEMTFKPPLIASLAARAPANSTAAPASVAENDGWLFAQPPTFYTLQLISAPRRATVDAFIRRRGLKDVRLLRTQVDGVRWWYLLSGIYPTRAQASDAAATSTIEQSSIWIRRFGALQKNRCKNLSAAGLSAFCDRPKVRVPTKGEGPQRWLESGKRQVPPSHRSVASVAPPAVTTPARPPTSTLPQTAPAGSVVTAELFAAAYDKKTAIAGLRHDDNAWLFAQPDDYYTVQLISVPDESQVARFLRDHNLQDKAIYYTTRRQQRDWYFAIYGSHPDLDAAKQATKALPVASGSVWIRQFDAIQKSQCQVANQLPTGVSDALNPYCRP